MKNTIKALLIVLTLAIVLVAFTGCADAVVWFTEQINTLNCKQFGHAMTAHGEVIPTCTEGGIFALYICDVCGYTEGANEELPALGHNWVDASCTEPKHCDRCDEVEGEALGHNMEDIDALAPTCTEDGYTAHKACACGLVEGKEVIPTEGHKWTTAAGGYELCEGCKNAIADTSEELISAISNATDGTTISVKAGVYTGLTFTTPSAYTVKDLTIVGEEGTVFDGLTFNNWNPVDISLVIDGLTIKNVTFDTKGLGLSTVDMRGVTVENCKFINDACIMQGDGNEKITDLVVKGCEFIGDGAMGTVTALMLENVENVSVLNCKFTNIDYNVLQSSTLAGTIIFDGNEVNGTGSRIFRIVNVTGEMTISNNVFVSDGDDAGELAKASNACEITLINNTWNGLSDEEVGDKLINITAKQ